MKPIQILLYVESRFKVNRKRVRATVKRVISEQNLQGPVEVSISFVGNRKMKEVSDTHLHDGKIHNILSFPFSEGEASVMPSDILRLGDIIISYPILIQESAAEEELVDDRTEMLVEHGMLHLLGIHHEE